MFFIILLITLLNKFIVCNEESNESRYIDLIPDEEKEQFLERIARRILEDGDVKDNNNKHSVEITDDQLNEHNDFVHKILQEESENLRRDSADAKNSDDKLEHEESETEKPRDGVERDLYDGKGTDLTVSRVRKKRRNSVNGIPTDNIKVEVKYDTINQNIEENYKGSPISLTVNENNKTHESETEKSIDKEPEQSDLEDIQVKNIRRHVAKESQEMKEVETITLDRNLDVTETRNFDFVTPEHYSEEITTKNKYKESRDGVDQTEIAENQTPVTETVNIETETFAEQSAVSFGFDSTPKENESLTNKNNTRDEMANEYITTTELTETLSQFETVITPNNYTELNKSVILKAGGDYTEIHFHKNDGNIKENASKNENYVSQTLRLTTDNYYPNNNNNNEINVRSQINNISTNNIRSLSFKDNKNQAKMEIKTEEPLIVSVTERLKSVNKNEHQNKPNTQKLDLSKTNESKVGIAKDILKALRLNLLREDIPSEKNPTEINKQFNKERNPEYPVESKMKEYKVYEIPEDKLAFTLRSQSKNIQNENQPYYIPTYNYSPNNAYFNAQNRYGPNVNDPSIERDGFDIADIQERSNERGLDTSKNNYDQRKFNFVKRTKYYKSGKIKTPKNFHLPLPIVTTKFPPVKRFVPGDYVDADYYFDRRDIPYLRSQSIDKPKRKLPDSHEDTHPSSNLNKVKSHIRAIRHILFEHKRFGYVGQVNSSELKSAETEDDREIETTTDISFFKLKRQGNTFDASKDLLKQDRFSEEYHDNLGKKIGYIKYLNFTKQLYLPYKSPEHNIFKFKALNGVAHFKRAKINNKDKNINLRLKIYTSTEKPHNQSRFLPYDPFHDIIDMTDEKDLLHTLEKLQALNITKTRSYDNSNELDAYVEVLKDMIYANNRGLKQYDWLGTTVDIQAAIRKLQELTESLLNRKSIHPYDLQLLKYVIYLHSQSNILFEMDTTMNLGSYELRNKLLPRIKKKRNNYVKDKGLLNRVWLLRRDGPFDLSIQDVIAFNEFLYHLQNALFDVHEAIKQIALITNVNNQSWFENLKQLYLNEDRRVILKIILHLSATRLFGMIEDNAADIEANLEGFTKENAEVVKRSSEGFKFLLNVLKEIMILSYS